MTNTDGTRDSEHSDAADDELLVALRRAAAVHDPPPTHLVEGVKGAFGLRRIDEELAELVSEPELAGIRGTAQATRFSFVRGDASVEIDLDDGRLVGVLVPGEPAKVCLETAAGVETTVMTDDRGRFVFDAPVGSIRFRTTLEGERIATDWFHV